MTNSNLLQKNNNKNMNKEKIILLIYLFISIGLVLSYKYNNTNIRLLVISISFIYLILASTNNGLALISFLLSYTSILKINLGSTSFVSYFLIIFLLKTLILKKFKLKNTILLTWLVLTIYASIRMLNVGINIDSLQFLINMFLIIVIASNIRLFDDIKSINFAFILGVITSSIAAISLSNVATVLPLWKESYVYGVRRFSGLEYDPNVYSVVLLIAISISTLMIFTDNNRSFYKIAFVLLIFMGLSTLSKTFVIGLLILFILIMILNGKKINRTLFIKAVTPILLLISILYFTNNDIQNLLEIMLNRFSGIESIDELSSTRLTIMSNYISLILESVKSFLFGYGFNSITIYDQGLYYSAHNTYLQLLFYLGIVGMTVTLIFFLSVFRSLSIKIYNTSNIILIVILSSMFSLDLIFKEFLPIVVSIYIINGYYIRERNKMNVN